MNVANQNTCARSPSSALVPLSGMLPTSAHAPVINAGNKHTCARESSSSRGSWMANCSASMQCASTMAWKRADSISCCTSSSELLHGRPAATASAAVAAAAVATAWAGSRYAAVLLWCASGSCGHGMCIGQGVG
eukprot:1155124-Pelagomonas_calceolata.AAC.9